MYGRLPDTILGHKVHTDFRVWLNFAQVITGNDLEEEELFEQLKLLFKDPPFLWENENPEQIFEGILNFFSCGKPKSAANSNGVKLMDYEEDSGSIYAAFMQQYAIDLSNQQLHWWQFKAMLEGISQDTQLGKIIQYRGINLSDIKDPDTKKFYREMQQKYALPKNKVSEEHINNVFARVF